jgi:hypothetical protein
MSRKDKENSEWVENTRQYRVENRSDGRYLILISKLPKDEVEYEMARLKHRHDKEAEILRKKYRDGFEWTLKEK